MTTSMNTNAVDEFRAAIAAAGVFFKLDELIAALRRPARSEEASR